MYQIVETTHEEKVKMYKKLSKKELIEMLIECNRIISSLPKRVEFQEPLKECEHLPYPFLTTSGKYIVTPFTV
jgi:hypothetical protein